MTLHSIRFAARTLALGTLTLANAALAGEPAAGTAADTPPSRLMADDFDEPEVPITLAPSFAYSSPRSRIPQACVVQPGVLARG